jgi:pimeloyl-ACP methyl ester carboxylesterase
MGSRFDVRIEMRTIEAIPAMMCIPVRSERSPVAFFIPGYWRTKTDGLSLGFQLGQQGVACVSFDPMYHGDRYDPRVEPAKEGVYLPEMGLDTFLQFLRVIRQSALDVGTLLNHLANDTRFDVHRAGVCGVSMGSYASFLAFAEIPTLLAAVPMMGIPTFARRWLDLLDECAWSNPEWAAVIERAAPQVREHTAYVQSIDPAEALQKIAPRALLAMNGDFDSDQPKHYTLEWLRSVRHTYADYPDRLRWNVYPVGHTVTPQMEQDAVGWFVRHLA